MNKRLAVCFLVLFLLTGCSNSAADENLVVEPQTDIVAVVEKQDSDYASKISSEDLHVAEVLACEDYESWNDEDWCIYINVEQAVFNEEESRRMREMYEDFREGWTEEYLVENFVAVKVIYDCKLDHNKIFYPDGEITKYTYLTRANAGSPWEIFDYGYN